ncbi:restriction endonuclease subunit S [Corallococcus sp. AB050B]|nr:restriction endonuclease subunit S [Corallococcus sp. AB050B]
MSFPRYPEYKESGVEWLGEVPSHWGLQKLKYIGSFVGGGTPSRERPDYWNGNIPWVSPKDMKSERITETEEAITMDGLANSTATLIPPQQVLMVVRSGILKHTIPVAINDVPVALNQDVKAISFSTHFCYSSYFLRWVQGLNDSLLSAWAKQGATVESLESEYLKNTVIALPTLAEQNAITAFLDRETAKIDELVAEQQRLIELLKEKREAVISHAVTKGLNPDAPMKPSGVEWLGEVPAHWEIHRIKHFVSSLEQGWSPQCEGTPAHDDEWGVLKVGCVNGGTFNPLENKLLPAELDPIPSLSVRAGDLLVSRANTRELVGSAAVPKQDYPRLMVCDKIYRIRLNNKICLSEFACRYLAADMARQQIELAATGASSSMLNIGQSGILELAIAVPPLSEQSAIVVHLDIEFGNFDALIVEAQHAIDLLQERRSGLISAAVTGQIDVRGIAGKAAA